MFRKNIQNNVEMFLNTCLNFKHMPNLLGLILDWDGTIADTLPDQFNWLKYCAQSFGKQFPYENLDLNFKKDYNRYYSANGINGLYDMIGVDFKANEQQIWKEYTDWKVNSHIVIFPDIKETIAEIYRRSRPNKVRSQGLRIVLNTTSRYSTIEKHFIANGLDQYFDSRVTREMLPEEKITVLTKPHAYSIEWALDLIGVHPGEAISVGDTTTDIIACKTLRRRRPDKIEQVKTVAVTWGYEPKEDLIPAQPDYFIGKPQELLQILKELGGID